MAAARGRHTIAWWMRLVAAVAVVCAIPKLPAALFVVLLAVAATLAALVALSLLSEAALGTSCPRCRQWALWPLALPRRPYRYYQCAACGGRLKRELFGPWHDASGPDDAAKYQRKRRPVHLEAPAPAPNDPSTCATLLRNKWLRARLHTVSAGDADRSSPRDR
jgi:hypothetical protein